MATSAGIASLPPARDFRVFVAAAIMLVAWTIMVAATKFFNDFFVTSDYFYLDIIYLAGFYLLSRASFNDPPGEVYKRNWAGYIVAIYAALILIQITHFFSRKEFILEPLSIAIFCSFFLLILWGFKRGFGWKIAAFYILIVIIVNLLALNFYLEVSNALTFSAIIIIMIQGLRGAILNINNWTGDSKNNFNKK